MCVYAEEHLTTQRIAAVRRPHNIASGCVCMMMGASLSQRTMKMLCAASAIVYSRHDSPGMHSTNYAALFCVQNLSERMITCC